MWDFCFYSQWKKLYYPIHYVDKPILMLDILDSDRALGKKSYTSLELFKMMFFDHIVTSVRKLEIQTGPLFYDK